MDLRPSSSPSCCYHWLEKVIAKLKEEESLVAMGLHSFASRNKREPRGHPAQGGPVRLGLRCFPQTVALPEPPQLIVVPSGGTRSWGTVGWGRERGLGLEKANLEKTFRRHAPPKCGKRWSGGFLLNLENKVHLKCLGGN